MVLPCSMIACLLYCAMTVTETFAETGEESKGTAQAFSRYAPFYDSDEQKNKVARWTRFENLKYLHSTFGPNELLLEIGCGTGTEAINLAKTGRRVVATDVAQGMIRHLR